MNKLTNATKPLHLDNANLNDLSVARLVQPGQRQRVLDAMQCLRQLGAPSSLGCPMQQAVGQGRD